MTERKDWLRIRSKLAEELSGFSNHSVEDIDLVLSAYPDLNRPGLGVSEFMEAIARMFLRDLSDSEEMLFNGLMSVVQDMEGARFFDDTYLGHMLTQASVPGMLGHILGVRVGDNTVAREVSRFSTELEPEAIKGLAEIIGFDPEKADGTFTSGGSMAMQTALMSARRYFEGEIPRNGKMVVITSPFVHYSVAKMCDIIGGPHGQVERRMVDSENLKISIGSLQDEIARVKKEGNPFVVIGIAGETETGLVDPLSYMAEITERNGGLFVVDGAYGAPYRLSRNAILFEGMEQAFAVTLDPHKALGTPYANGAVLWRDKENMFFGYADRAEYLGKGNLGQKRIEGSMGPDPILSTLAVLRTLGLRGLEVMYDLTLDRIEYLYERVEKSSLLVSLHRPELNLLCFTCSGEALERLGISAGDHEKMEGLIESTRTSLDKGVEGAGGYFFSGTRLPLDGGTAIWTYRSCIMNPRTTNKIIDDAVFGLETEIESRFIR